MRQVGSYGRIDKATGDLSVQGNIYSDEFKQLLVNAGINPDSDEHHPKDCPDESEFTTWSKHVKRIDLNLLILRLIPDMITFRLAPPEVSLGLPTASIKGTWQVKKGTTGAVLLMNNPRIKHITSDVLGKLASIQLLQSMHLVTKVFYCPAYSLYLSDTSECISSELMILIQVQAGEKITMALLASAPVVAPVGTLEAKATMKWWSDTQTGLARHGCKTEHCFTPLYELLHVRHPRNRRTSPSPERTGEQLWIAPPLPWAPLREDGTEVPIYINENTDSSDSEEE
ncbi:uncharacterized protein EDB91DRAFT_1288309 [Suillus paluster]|uniref:uncharacterized protein n=1 Tax=Suillus paluster TaxID=48578 RepID=UPI001B87E260|nr:uncharacterized protein EDB91DRAFT_1288309 [Suillus paluster]KAG1719556.1 hypothetical protein EDB91DRAFT_1288309 [Suillus paluster]